MAFKLNFNKAKSWSQQRGRELGKSFNKAFSRASSRRSKKPKNSKWKKLLPSPSKLKWLGVFLLGFLIADFCVQAFNAYFPIKAEVSGKSRAKIKYLEPRLQNISHYEKSVSLNRFCPGCPVPDLQSRVVERPKDCNKAKLSSRPKLIGTVVLSDPRYSIATVEDGGESKALVNGEDFKSYGKIFEIQRDKVCFAMDDGRLSYIKLPEKLLTVDSNSYARKDAAPQTSADAVTQEKEITRQFLLDSLADPNLLQQAYAVPHRDDSGNIAGFKIMSIKKGSVYDVLGFKAQDILTHVDGDPLNNLSKVQDLWSNIKNIDALELTVTRRGSPKAIKFNVKN